MSFPVSPNFFAIFIHGLSRKSVIRKPNAMGIETTAIENKSPNILFFAYLEIKHYACPAYNIVIKN
jgi:hypothetical protein